MKETVTCSFSMDRKIYNEFKSIITRNGENVKGNIVNYMMNVIKYETPNPETIKAIKEVEDIKKNPDNYKSYSDVDEMMGELLADV